MRALDSNVLLRYVVGDDPDQTATAERIMDQCKAANERAFIPVLVLCETVWVLQRIYRQSKGQIIETLEAILAADLFWFEHEPLVRRAFDRFCESRADFSDYLIGEIATAAGCRDTVPCDRALKGSRGFTIL